MHRCLWALLVLACAGDEPTELPVDSEVDDTEVADTDIEPPVDTPSEGAVPEGGGIAVVSDAPIESRFFEGSGTPVRAIVVAREPEADSSTRTRVEIDYALDDRATLLLNADPGPVRWVIRGQPGRIVADTLSQYELVDAVSAHVATRPLPGSVRWGDPSNRDLHSFVVDELGGSLQSFHGSVGATSIRLGPSEEPNLVEPELDCAVLGAEPPPPDPEIFRTQCPDLFEDSVVCLIQSHGLELVGADSGRRCPVLPPSSDLESDSIGWAGRTLVTCDRHRRIMEIDLPTGLANYSEIDCESTTVAGGALFVEPIFFSFTPALVRYSSFHDVQCGRTHHNITVAEETGAIGGGGGRLWMWGRAGSAWSMTLPEYVESEPIRDLHSVVSLSSTQDELFYLFDESTGRSLGRIHDSGRRTVYPGYDDAIGLACAAVVEP